MLACDTTEAWVNFLDFVKTRCSPTAYGNWLAPIRVLESSAEGIVLEVPNIFVQEYLISNYRDDLRAFLPVNSSGDPVIRFQIAVPIKKSIPKVISQPSREQFRQEHPLSPEVKLNNLYRFDTFIEGPENQFVKSAAMGVALRPGESHNPLFIHGGVGRASGSCRESPSPRTYRLGCQTPVARAFSALRRCPTPDSCRVPGSTHVRTIFFSVPALYARNS